MPLDHGELVQDDVHEGLSEDLGCLLRLGLPELEPLPPLLQLLPGVGLHALVAEAAVAYEDGGDELTVA